MFKRESNKQLRTNKSEQTNQNTNKQTMKGLVELGLENTYTHAPLCIQRRTLLELAVAMNLITPKS